MSTKQNTKSSDWKLSKLHLLLFKRADDGPTEEWRDEARKTELISSSHGRQLKRKKYVTFPSGRRVLLWHARKGPLLSTLCSAGPEWEFDFEFGALFSSLLLPNKLKLVSDPSPNQCGRNCAIKKSERMLKCSKENETNFNTTWRHIQESRPHIDLLEGDVVYVT